MKESSHLENERDIQCTRVNAIVCDVARKQPSFEIEEDCDDMVVPYRLSRSPHYNQSVAAAGDVR